MRLKVTPEIINDTLNLIADRFHFKEYPEIMLKLLKSRRIGPPIYYLERCDESILHIACYKG
jgi:hypothetical protein